MDHRFQSHRVSIQSIFSGGNARFVTEREQDQLQAERGALAAGGSAGLQAASVTPGAFGKFPPISWTGRAQSFLNGHKVEACIPDNHFRSRDPHFARQERHKSSFRGDGPDARYAPKKEAFGLEHFRYNSKRDTYTCPWGKELTGQSASPSTGDVHRYRRYRAKARDCAACPLKGQCIARGGARKSLAIPVGGEPATRTARMRRKIDTPEARALYARRLAIVEPVFANIRSNKRLDWFTYRGLAKVNVQWLLYCLVHNLEKIAHFGRKYGPKRRTSALTHLVAGYCGS